MNRGRSICEDSLINISSVPLTLVADLGDEYTNMK